MTVLARELLILTAARLIYFPPAAIGGFRECQSVAAS